jgi:predicted S18 family serine protease
MSIRKRMLSLFIIVLVLTVCVNHVLGVQGNPAQTKAKIFIDVAEKAGSIAVELTERIQASGEDTAPRLRLIDEGNTLLDMAKDAYNRGEYDRAAADARLAQTKYREAMRGLGPVTPQREENVKERLTEAIQRARERIKRIRDIIASSTETREDLVKKASENLDQAEQLLKDAESIISSGVQNASEAARKLAQAEKKMSLAFTLLKQASKEPNKHRVEAYIDRLEKQLSRLRDWVERLGKRGVKQDRLTQIKTLLGEAENLIKSAEAKITSDNLAEALADIERANEIMRQATKLIRSQRP